MDTSGEAKFDVAGAGCPPATLIGDVILHSGIVVNLKLNGLYQTSKTRIILSSIFVVGIVLWIINVLLWPVYTKSLLCDFKFFCSIAKREETQNPDLDILVDYSLKDGKRHTKIRIVGAETPFKLPTSTA